MQTSTTHKVFSEIPGGAKAKQLKQARTSCLAALKASPKDVQCLHTLGLIDCQLGQMNTAQEWFEKALAINAGIVDILYHYGLCLLEQGKYTEAIDAFRKAVALVPDHSESHYNMAVALAKSGKADEALALYKYVLTLNPDHFDALNNMGNILSDQGKMQDAIRCFAAIIGKNPHFVKAYNNSGLVLTALGQMDAAEKFFLRALELRPDYPEALNNLGISFMLRDRFDEAIMWLQKALKFRPQYPEALNNLGNVYKDSGQLGEAVKSYRKAVGLKNSPEFRHNLALALLAVGRFDEGWREYESRWDTRQLSKVRRPFTQPQWHGEDAAGKVLLIHAEQGFGDTLQFCRYARLAKDRGLRVIMEVPRGLVKLIGSLEGVDHVVGNDRPLPDFDLHCPMLSLPLAFAMRWDRIPATVPYLSPEPHAVSAWRERLPDAAGALRVGLVWAGGARNDSQDLIATNRRRSLTPEALAPLMEVPGVQFFSLQKIGPRAPDSFGLIDYMDDCNDFADTAALIANLDLVITVDTSIAHLAGALAKPVWVLNRFNSCWRWQGERDDSPWYPTLRLFRQASLGDWDGVILRVRDELAQLAGAKKA